MWTVTLKFKDFSRSLSKKYFFQGIPGLDQKLPKFKDFLVFQVAYKPCFSFNREDEKCDCRSHSFKFLNFSLILTFYCQQDDYSFGAKSKHLFETSLFALKYPLKSMVARMWHQKCFEFHHILLFYHKN